MLELVHAFLVISRLQRSSLPEYSATKKLPLLIIRGDFKILSDLHDRDIAPVSTSPSLKRARYREL
jgi:hypothetical protein